MYLRTTRRRNRDGSTVEYYQLAHNVRHPDSGQSVAQVIHTFGRSDQLDRDALVRLCRSIARVCGLDVQDPLTEPTPSRPGGAPWPEDVRIRHTRALGCVVAIEALWERLGIGPALRQIAQQENCTVPYERALLAMTANRLCEPSSKLGVWDRWLPTVHLPSCWELKLAQMYEAMDLLARHAAHVEEAVFFQTADLLNLEVDLVFYDTTTASFTIDEEDGDGPGLRQRGRNKEGTWHPQVVVALAVTREGIPVRSWVFPGNTSDVETVERVRQELRGWKLGRCLFVADGGMNSEANRKLLTLGGGTYLLAVRAGSVKEVQEQVLSRPGRYKTVTDNLKVKEITVGDGVLRRRYILCFNPAEATRQQHHRAGVLAEIREELSRHKTWDATAKWAIEMLASGRTGRYLSISPTSQIYLDAQKVKKAETLDGKWVLITNDDTLTAADAAQGYQGLLVIEQCFRSLKSTQIQLTPVHHWLARRIEAHVKICVLALLIQRVAEVTCQLSWAQIHERLSALQATQFQTSAHQFFRRNEVPPETAQILKSLKISTPPLVLSLSSAPSET